MARKFFVGGELCTLCVRALLTRHEGNFKMNGTVESTKKIIEGLNAANLDSNTGKLLILLSK